LSCSGLLRVIGREAQDPSIRSAERHLVFFRRGLRPDQM
jgi:hypothetical protein